MNRRREECPENHIFENYIFNDEILPCIVAIEGLGILKDLGRRLNEGTE